MVPESIDFIALIGDLNKRGWPDMKIEFACGYSTGYIAQLKLGRIKDMRYDRAARLYNFHETAPLYSRPRRKGFDPEVKRKKDNARARVNRRQQRGKLVASPCEVCGTTENLEKHHDDYDKPAEIRWLCVECHRNHHARKNTN